MQYETLLYDVEDGILTLTLNRPARLNAFTPTMMDEMISALDRADADDAVRVIIVTGAGRAFCAGADLSEGAASFDYGARSDLPEDQQTPVLADGSPDLGHESVRDGGGRLSLRLFDCLKPVIAAVNGAAVGVGVTMQLPMDIRLASSDARFGLVFARRGITPEACSSWFLSRVVGIDRALEWAFTGRIFGADEALASGLVSAVHAPDDLLPAARRLAREIADNSAPVSVALTRQMIWKMAGADHPMEAHKVDSRAIWSRGRSADAQEGVGAFLEKRPASFPDRVSTDMPSFYPWWQPRPYR
jgi:enoyl-CoA hydratase/carnithine racemase